MAFFIYSSISKPTLKKLQTNYTPSKSSRSSSIEQDETTIEIPHPKNEVVSNRKTQTPDKQPHSVKDTNLYDFFQTLKSLDIIYLNVKRYIFSILNDSNLTHNDFVVHVPLV